MGKIYTFNNKIITINNKWCEEYVEPTPPLPPIPLNCVRVRTSDGNVPVKTSTQFGSTSYETATLVEGTTDVYDVYKQTNGWGFILYASTNVVEIVGANTTGISGLFMSFSDCTALTTINLFDTSNIANMNWAFCGDTSLTSIPLFDTTNLTHLQEAFAYCPNVESGALALYNQMSTQTNPPTNHSGVFTNCGSNTTTGAAELAQIPSSWGGTGA